MKIVCYNEFLVSAIKPKVENAKNKLNIALAKAQITNIPNDFPRRNDILQTKELLASISNELTNYSNWLSTFNKNMIAQEEKTSIRINNIPNIYIQNRNER